jgi:hypothetical protein
MSEYYQWSFYRDPYDTYPREYPQRLDTLIQELEQVAITREQVLHILDFQETAPHLSQAWLDISEYLIYILQSLVALERQFTPDEPSSEPRNPYKILTEPVRDWLQKWVRWVKREDDPELQEYETRKDIIIWGNMEHISAACNVILNARNGDFS